MENEGPPINELIDWRMCCEMTGGSIRAAEVVNYTLAEMKELLPPLRQVVNEKNLDLTKSATRNIMDSRLSRVPLPLLYESFSDLEVATLNRTSNLNYLNGGNRYGNTQQQAIHRRI